MGRPKSNAGRCATRILVCDDERHIVRLIQVNLERQGHEVACAYGGREAIDLLGREWFDIAILDPDMPEVSGLDVKRWIEEHEETRHIRVMLLDWKPSGDVFRL